jgi:microcystin-dependent protein
LGNFLLLHVQRILKLVSKAFLTKQGESMDQPFVGQINAFGFSFAPRSWALCSGQLLAISTNQALFSLLGTYFGGDGRTNFGLPDLRGRTSVGQGMGPGISINWGMGSQHGIEFQQLTVNEMPSHTHSATFTPSGGGPVTVEVNASTDDGSTATPVAGAYLANVIAGGGAADKPEKIYRDDAGNGTVPLGGVVVDGGAASGGMVQVQHTGNGNNFPIIQPGLGLNYSIALDGLYPPRN